MQTSFLSREELEEIGFASLGEDVSISRKTSIYSPEKMRIGNHVRIDDFCVISGMVSLGNNIHISAYCCLFGGDSGIEMWDFSGLSSRCALYAMSDDYSGISLTNPTLPDKYRQVYGGKVVLEKHVIIGTGATVLPDLRIGEGTSVGSMSLVNKSLEPWGIYVGIPCRRVKDREKDLLKLAEKYLREEL